MNHKILLLLIFAILFISNASAIIWVNSSFWIGEGLVTTGGVNDETSGTTWLAQTFTTDEPFTVREILLATPYQGSNPETAYISIRATNTSGHPTGADLSTGQFNSSKLPTASNNSLWTNITMSSYALLGNTTYAVVVNTKDTTGQLGIRLYNGNGYSRGSLVSSANSGVIWTLNANYDFLFLVLGNSTRNEMLNFSVFNNITRYMIVPNEVDTITTTLFYLTNYSDVTRNLTVFVGMPDTTRDFYFNGTFNGFNRSIYLSNVTNAYKRVCSRVKNTSINGYCYIPIIFSTATSGEVLYEKIMANNTGHLLNYMLYNKTTYETTLEMFILNISYDNILYPHSLINFAYNSVYNLPVTSSESNGEVYSIYNIDAPLVSSMPTFLDWLWDIYLYNSSNYEFTFGECYTWDCNQSISHIFFVSCNATATTKAVNFTVFDQTLLTITNVTWKATFKSKVSLNSNTTKTSTLNNDTGTYIQEMCIFPNTTFYVSSYIELSKSGYNTKAYQFLDELYTNSKLNVSLFIGNETITDVAILVQDTGQKPLPNYVVEVYRYYPATNNYLLIHSGITDFYGQVNTELIENTVVYRIKVYDSDGTLKQDTGDVHAVCYTSPCTMTVVIGDTFDYLTRLGETSGVTCTFTYNNNTRTFLFSWTDATSDSATYRMQVVRYLANGTTYVYNSTSTNVISSLSYTAGTAKASYVAQIFRRVGSTERRYKCGDNDVLNAKIGDLSAIFGIEGMMASFFLLFTFVLLGIWNPPLGIIYYFVGSLLLGQVDILFIPIEIIIAQGAIGALFIWAFKT